MISKYKHFQKFQENETYVMDLPDINMGKPFQLNHLILNNQMTKNCSKLMTENFKLSL